MVSSIAVWQSQFNISHLFAHSSIWPTDRTQSVAAIPGQSGPESTDNEGVFHIPQISKVGVSPSDVLMS